ncbi:MAG: hypothetical protein AB9836_03420 [Aminipila sp.]
MGILDILIIFIVFAVVWLGTQILWKVIEGKMILKQQERCMDLAYSKGIRLIARGLNEWRTMKELVKHGSDRM